MASQYFTKAPSTYAQYNITNAQINVLKACLVDETLATEEAAKQLTAHPEAFPTPVELQQRLAGLWTILNDTAVNLPSSQPKVIAILQTIRIFPKMTNPGARTRMLSTSTTDLSGANLQTGKMTGQTTSITTPPITSLKHVEAMNRKPPAEKPGSTQMPTQPASLRRATSRYPHTGRGLIELVRLLWMRWSSNMSLITSASAML